MGWLSDLLKEYPALSVETERLALMEAENKKQKMEDGALQNERHAEQKRQRFREFKGVLWTEHNGKIDPTVYCPYCEFAMAVILSGTSEMIVCSKCNFIASFQAKEIENLTRSLETELRSL
ncbi:MAG: hypothetical protein ACI915_000040 [Gammaproteobacteria bacterium]|jgi:hypothetical protein